MNAPVIIFDVNGVLWIDRKLNEDVMEWMDLLDRVLKKWTLALWSCKLRKNMPPVIAALKERHRVPRYVWTQEDCSGRYPHFRKHPAVVFAHLPWIDPAWFFIVDDTAEKIESWAEEQKLVFNVEGEVNGGEKHVAAPGDPGE